MKQVTCAGIIVADLIAADLPRVAPAGGITFTPHGINVHIGGHAANVAVDLVGLGQKATQIRCLAAVGKDVFGLILERALKRYGISTRLQRIAAANTCVDLILVVKGQDRRFHCHVGANAFLDSGFVLRTVQQDRPWLFYLGGVGLMARLDGELASLMKEVKKLGSLTFVDPVPPVDHQWDHLRRALRWIDVLHCNDAEVRHLTGRPGIREAIQQILSHGTGLVVVSRGEKGVVAGRQGRLMTLDSFQVETLDPTGAGDAFCAAFIRRIVQKIQASTRVSLDWTDQELADMLVEAEAAGAACVTGIGTTSAVTRKNVKSLLESQAAQVWKTLRFFPL